MKLNLTYNILLITLFALLLSPGAAARPAKNGPVILVQPDGSTFTALIKGDERVRIKTTLQGHAVVQDADGWWCYAVFDEDGSRHSSGYRIGQETPQAVISQSLNVPLRQVAERAAQRWNTSAEDGREPLLARMRSGRASLQNSDGLQTRAEGAQAKHGIVILAQFSDTKFRYTREDFVNMLTQEGYSVNGATGSAKEYFDAQFHGMFDFSFDVSPIVTVSKTAAYYGGNDSDGNDKAPAELIEEACRKADADVDFSLYDDDGDGEVDNVFLFFAGEDEAEGASEDCIWSHAWYIYSGAGIKLSLDGKVIDRYACTSELARRYANGTHEVYMAGIGTFCHEYSHTFGLPDFYDTDYDEDGGWAAGLWTSTALMDGGNQNNNGNTPPYLNALERELLGIAEPTVIGSDGAYTLEPVHLNGQCYKLPTDRNGEYYLIECRSNEGWDKYIGGSGMLVYHIDRTVAQQVRWTHENTVNAVQTHQCADLIEADGRTDAFTDTKHYTALTSNIGGIFFPYGNTTALTYDTTPALSWWSGEKGAFVLTGITRDGNNITFSVIGGSEATTPPSPVGITYESFMDAAIISFSSSHAFEGEATVSWGLTGKEMQSVKVAPYESGRYSVTLEGLESGNKTYTVSICFEIGGAVGESASVSFMTRRKPSVSWPFIHIGNAERNSDGTFPAGSRLPLRVYNATDAAEVEWFFNGRRITTEGDGYYTIKEGGELKAKVIWEDGGTDTIVKQIVIGE